MYSIDNIFFHSPIEYLNRLTGYSKESLHNEQDDYVLEANICEFHPMANLSAEDFVWAIDEERFDEERSQEDDLIELFNKYIDFEAINKEIPKLYYPTGKMATWNKKELISAWGK